MAENIRQLWSLEDTFNQWLLKYNASQELINELNEELENLGFDFLKSEFTYVPKTADSLTVTILDGKVRYGSEVEKLDSVEVTLVPNTTSVVGIYRGEDETTSSIQAFVVDEVPDGLFVPLYIFVTNATTVAAFDDLRTRFSLGGGGSGDGAIDGAIIQIDQMIMKNVNIKPGKNAISVSPTVGDGFTVVVGEGSDWVIL